MWSVRSRSARVYLSRAKALVDVAGAPVSEVMLPPDAAFADSLALLDSALPKSGVLRLHLSAGLCPAVEVTYPAGVHRLREKEIFARSVCAAQLGTEGEGPVIQFDPLGPSIVAAVARAHWDALASWSRAGRHQLASVQPLWSVAMRSRAARAAASLALVEPDSISLLGASAHDAGQLRALSLPLHSPQQAALTLHRMHRALAVPMPGTCIAVFGRAGSGTKRPAPREWPAYWAMR